MNARPAVGIFSPQRVTLRIDGHGYSPAELEKIVMLGGEAKSFQRAAKILNKVTESERPISDTHVGRLTHMIGQELIADRQARSEQHRLRQLPVSNRQSVDIACVEFDGGRICTRAAGRGRGTYEAAWRESKVACLWRMTGETFEKDPHPAVPRCFLDPPYVDRLVRELKNRGVPHTEEDLSSANDTPSCEDSGDREPWPPKRVFRTCVAALMDIYKFGPLVAAEAQSRGFYQAARQVFLGDGDHKNWTLQKLHFPHFTAITDFVHAVGYIYLSAGAVTASFAALWEQYVEWLTACWQGRVDEVIEEIALWQQRLGSAPDDAADNDPAVVVETTLTYLKNNASRMDYAHYRQQGLPITSCLVESLIKEFNVRVKGTEKTWNRAEEGSTTRCGAASILEVRSAVLSDDDRITKWIQNRPGHPFFRRRSPISTSSPK